MLGRWLCGDVTDPLGSLRKPSEARGEKGQPTGKGAHSMIEDQKIRLRKEGIPAIERPYSR